MAESFIALLDSIYPQEDAVKEYLREHIKVRSYPKGHHLVEVGSINDRMYYIERGLVRAYAFKKVESVSTWFMMEGDLAMLPDSFYTETPSEEAIELLEDSVVLELRKESMEFLYSRYMCANVVGRLLEQITHVKLARQFREVRFFTKEERYLSLIDRWPALFNRVPLKLIASFLGMHERTLIRTRRAIARRSKKRK